MSIQHKRLKLHDVTMVETEENNSHHLQKEFQIVPRDYQIQLSEYAIKRNCIIYLPTNSGKTYISVLVIRHFTSKINGPFQSGKRAIFLAPTTSLVQQQCEYLKAHLPLEIDFFIGAKGIDTWNREKWNDQFEKNNVLLMTPMILQNLLEYQIIDKERIALIIFDEAHWAACTIKDNNTVVPSNYSYNVILKCIQPSQMPNIRLVGLTASLINSIIPFHQIPIYIRYLEQAFNGTCIGAMGNPVYSNEMTIHCWTYRGKPLSLNLLKLMIGQVLSLIEAFATKTKGNRKWTIDCLKQSDSEDGDNQDLPAEENRILIKVAYFFVWTQIVLERLGVAITQDLILWCRDDLQNQLTAAVDSNPELACFLRQVLHVFKYIFCTFERTISHVADPKTRLYSLMTPKVLRLLDIIRHYRTKTGDKFRCLIFVSRRIFAILLSRMLNNLSGIDAEFSFLKSGVIFSRNAQDALLTQTCKQQNEYLLKFRKNELNCLVTTSVLEEGIDVPQCNLVIRFDDIHTFREWVQSKGRARLSNSIFILLHSEERRRQLLETTKEFTKLEQFLSQLDDGNRVSEDVTVVDKNLEDKVVSKTGRICSASQAYNQLRKYCSQTLDAANFPQWSVHRYDQHYQVEVQLPIKSQIKGRIVGKQCTSINSARDSAMLEAIRQLYEIGELCDNFFPKQKDEILNDLLKKRIKPLYNVKEYSELFLKPAAMRENLRKKEEAENTANTTNQNGSKTNQNQALSQVVLERAILDKSRFKRMVKTEEWYLYRVQYSSSNQSAYNFDLNDDSSFGFLAKVNISLDDKLFTVASTHQEIHMKPQLIKAISLTKEEFERLLLMYARLNRNVVPKNMRKYLTLNQNPLFITVPILEDEIDMDKVMWYLSGSMPENANDIKVGCVVTSKHIGNQYYVTSLTSDRYPSKSILKDNLTYEEYFKRKYDIVLQEPNREMLTAKPCRILTRVRLNPQMLRQDTFHNEEVHLPPELVFVEPITLQMANQLQCIELLYYRLQQLMLMQDLDNKIKTNIFSMKADEGHSESFEQELIKLRRTPSIVDGGASMSKIDDVESLIDGTFCKRIVPSQSTEIDRLSERMAPLKLSNAKVPSNVKINQIEFINSNLNQNFGKSNFDISSELNQRLREELILNNEEYDTLLIMLRLQLENFTSSLQTNGSSKKKTNDKQKESKPMATIQNHNVKEGIAIDFNTWCLRPLRPEDNLINLYDLREALTPCAAYDLINLERYEIIGDAFLKFVVCNLIFFLCVDLDEGRMSSLKSHIVSNVNLFDCAKRRGLDQYIQATKTELYLNWLPSSYEFKEEVEDNVRRPFFKQEIRAKTVSDAIEAMIGASLVSNGFFATLLLMKWLGIPVDIPSQPLNPSSTMLNWLPALDLISTSNNPVEANAQVKKLYERAGFSTLEKKIDYKFHNKALIVKALTHQGYHDNTTTGSFETLEFLGDAVIDYLLTRFLYENKERMYSPGDISSIRCAIVNNAYFGVLATRLNLFRHFLLNDQVISRQLSGYVAYCEKEYQPGQLVIQDFIVLKDLKVVPLEQVKTPKLMGDLFESVVGAIYLDSGRDLNVVWKFLFRQIQVELTYFSQNIPINFINCSLELAPTGKFVSKPKPDNSSDESHVAFVVDGKEYLGSGCNRITSRLSAARNFIYQHVHKRDLKTKVNNK